jgi:hypothetical protein
MEENMRIGCEKELRDSYIYLLRNSYTLRIRSGELIDPRNLLVKFIVLEKNCETALQFSLEKQNLWRLRELLEACGKPVPRKQVKIDLTKLIGLQCGATLIEDGVIGFFFPLNPKNRDYASGWGSVIKKSPTANPQRSVKLSPIEVLGFECVDCGSRHFREVLAESEYEEL